MSPSSFDNSLLAHRDAAINLAAALERYVAVRDRVKAVQAEQVPMFLAVVAAIIGAHDCLRYKQGNSLYLGIIGGVMAGFNPWPDFLVMVRGNEQQTWNL